MKRVMIVGFVIGFILTFTTGCDQYAGTKCRGGYDHKLYASGGRSYTCTKVAPHDYRWKRDR